MLKKNGWEEVKTKIIKNEKIALEIQRLECANKLEVQRPEEITSQSHSRGVVKHPWRIRLFIKEEKQVEIHACAR